MIIADHLRVWQIILEPSVRVSHDRQVPFPRRSLPWNPPKLSRDEFIRQMRTTMEEALGRVADAINEAPPGQIISGSE